MKRGAIFLFLLLLGGLAAWFYRQFFRMPSLPARPRTVALVLDALGPSVDRRLAPHFRRAGLAYPPVDFTLLAFKAERRLELYAGHPRRRVISWPVLAAGGEAGPKLCEGDGQVPEGFYPIIFLNPNSLYHLSLRVGYPNAEDLARAREDGRDPAGLGGDIMIHGGAQSIGCLAIGDAAIEELFVLAARTGTENIRLIIAPCDFRSGAHVEIPAAAPAWAGGLHERLREELGAFPLK